MKWLGLFALLSCYVVSAGCYLTHETTSGASCREAFREIFGIEPPPSFAGAQTSWKTSPDIYSQRLVFLCDDNAISEIKAIKGIEVMKDVSPSNGPGDRFNRNAPTWWKEAVLSSAVEKLQIIRSAPGSPKGFDNAYIWIDHEKRVVYADRVRDRFHMDSPDHR